MTLPTNPVAWATKAFQDGRNETIDKYQEYLEGHHPVAFATKSFRKTFGSTFESFAYNRLESVIDAHANRLQVTGIAANEDALAQDAQDQWDDNRMDVRENESTQDALAYGDGFLIVEADPTIANRVHYWINDPRNIRVHYSDEAPGELDLAAKQWVGEDGYARLNLYFMDRVEKYISRNKAQTGIIATVANADSWQHLEDESFTLPVTDTVPVFHLGNKARTNQYGISEIKLLVPLQDAMNFVLMSSMVATEFAAFSQKVIMGVQPESPEEKEQMAQFQSGVDRILMLFDENSKIGEFSPSDLSKYIELAEFWDSTISRVSHVPLHYLNGGVAESGEAKRLREAPFTSKIIDRQRAFGFVYGEVVRYGLRLTGKNIEPGAVRVNWESAAPHSEQEQWELIRLMRDAGMPFQSALRIGYGFDEDQIASIMEDWEMERTQAQRFFDRGAVDVSFGAEGESA